MSISYQLRAIVSREKRRRGGEYAGWTRELRQGRTLHTPLNKFVKGTVIERKGGGLVRTDGRTDGDDRGRFLLKAVGWGRKS